MTFVTVFDASHPRFNANSFALVVFVIAGAALVAAPGLRRALMPRLQERTRRILSWCVLVLALLMAPLGLFNAYQDRVTAAADLSQGRYAVAEGAITDFSPLLSQKGTLLGGRFTVADHRFAYSTNEAGPGFHGPGTLVHDGLYVRVFYAGDVILRLDAGHPG